MPSVVRQLDPFPQGGNSPSETPSFSLPLACSRPPVWSSRGRKIRSVKCIPAVFFALVGRVELSESSQRGERFVSLVRHPKLPVTRGEEI